ncbi:ABC transporter permease [Uliginosibacterium sp. TH139]|uniref:ABC transporter permease n=1 Tax=Uliginosibacterium sp. TH139 TaxID=2067453 RepID=UPI000C795F77|nr:ABC transporter permease [Uliginosibacterium sp. TH139]PLK48110.1 ABC transporter permease [Uliginosibacterium sp. TH139]
MLTYFLKRLAFALPIALAVSALCFSLVYLAPGDPLSAVLPSDASQEMIEKVKASYGLDKPIVVQYAIWLGHALQGDLGQSISTGRAVASEIGAAIGNSLMLALLASGIGFTLGAALGVIAGYTHGSKLDRLLSAIAISGVSIPHYWLGIVLVAIFSVKLNMLPAMGAGASDLWNWERLSYMILPAITLAAIPTGIVMRSVRALVADTLGREFVTGLVAKGMGRGVVFRHLIKNIAPTALAVIGVQLGYLMAGSILVETVFSWPGTGLLLNNAIQQRDIPLLQGTILVLAMFFVGLNLLVDMLQPLFDPRISRS